MKLQRTGALVLAGGMLVSAVAAQARDPADFAAIGFDGVIFWPGHAGAPAPTLPFGPAFAVSAPGGEKMYWTDWLASIIQRANLDGSSVEDLTSSPRPQQIALDLDAGKMYWADQRDMIRRANLDGTSVENLVTGLEAPSGMALDLQAGKMYWTDWLASIIQRANLDGTGVENLVTAGLSEPLGLALDVVAGQMYWTDNGTNKIQRADLDGSNVEDLVTAGLDGPRRIELDLEAAKMYWTDQLAGRIQRANLDGSAVEDVLNVPSPAGLALDLLAGKIYWTQAIEGVVRRANLDGSQVEDLVFGLENPLSIALALEVEVLALDLDIKPGSCPNSFNRNSHGMLPAAILGSDDFDAAQIDISSVMLSRADGIGGTVAPHEGPPGPHSVLDDVATPFDGEPCDCHELGGDGLIDLVMHFSSPELVETLELSDLPADTQVPLMVSGELIDGSPFTATDCIRLVPAGDMNGDGVVGVSDLLALLAAWGPNPGHPADFDSYGSVSASDLLALLANWGPCP